jgi:hypothetical protein
MTPEQRKALVRASKTPASGAAQAVAVLLGLGALLLSVQALLGYTALDATTYTEFVLVVVFVAFGCAVAARALRQDAHRAIQTGVVLELRGVPGRSETPGAIDIGGVSFTQGSGWIPYVRRNSLNLLTFVELGRPSDGRLRVLVLGVNRQQFPRALPGRVALPPSSVPSPVPAGAAAAGA